MDTEQAKIMSNKFIDWLIMKDLVCKDHIKWIHLL